MDKLLSSKYTSKLMAVLSVEPQDSKECVVLIRIIRCVPDVSGTGFYAELEVDMRRASLVIKTLGLSQCKGVVTHCEHTSPFHVWNRLGESGKRRGRL